ncbi:hypothetical protein [Paludisphaera soli]|uniref:hypothetical protein n=1 Tax=Paludisphaera soli TaxID=2712865 RepID=UPI0013ED36E8|nr:hypothetical protein [Paludisphaera soli]
MMRPRSLGLAMSACAMLAGAVLAAGEPGPGGAETPRAHVVPPEVGSRCRIELNPTTAGRDETVAEYEGVVVRSSAEGVGLSVVEKRVTVVRKTPLARVPYLERLFRNVGVSRSGSGAGAEVWLPTATIRSVRRTPTGAARPDDPRVSTPEFSSIDARPAPSRED